MRETTRIPSITLLLVTLNEILATFTKIAKRHVEVNKVYNGIFTTQLATPATYWWPRRPTGGLGDLLVAPATYWWPWQTGNPALKRESL